MEMRERMIEVITFKHPNSKCQAFNFAGGKDSGCVSGFESGHIREDLDAPYFISSRKELAERFRGQDARKYTLEKLQNIRNLATRDFSINGRRLEFKKHLGRARTGFGRPFTGSNSLADKSVDAYDFEY
jgi:hypothetical protein